MTNPSAKSILEYGLVSGNTGLVQLLGLCPLLAVSNNAVNALGLGLASLLALTLTNTVVASLRRLSRRDVRIPAFVTIIASVVTAIELSLRAWLPELYQVLGLFVPLIVTNCAIMGRAEAFASRHNPARAALDGFAFGLGFLWVLLLIGVVRELVGTGTVFAGSGAMLGMPWLELTVLGDYHGFLPAILPPGAFIVLALLIALRNRRQRHITSAQAPAPSRMIITAT
ncbi:MAG: electron transport complex subunit RsxE [Gammaproteobacteria bacterium HGW-Gammaproteobacteria-2]|nr:MAG: electron transport complex subunit RsxE [Gammaproteobacteria bacterium HGW-Gammaproteobacteria-2]